jgi:hypothetical protein
MLTVRVTSVAPKHFAGEAEMLGATLKAEDVFKLWDSSHGKEIIKDARNGFIFSL